MRNLTKITYLLMADIQESKELYQNVFWTHLNVDYMEIAYREFDQNLTLITKRVIDQACDDMKPRLFDGRENQPGIKSNIDTGTNTGSAAKVDTAPRPDTDTRNDANKGGATLGR